MNSLLHSWVISSIHMLSFALLSKEEEEFGRSGLKSFPPLPSLGAWEGYTSCRLFLHPGQPTNLHQTSRVSQKTLTPLHSSCLPSTPGQPKVSLIPNGTPTSSPTHPLFFYTTVPNGQLERSPPSRWYLFIQQLFDEQVHTRCWGASPMHHGSLDWSVFSVSWFPTILMQYTQ